VALPGGKQDETDASDESTAMREILEEVGIDVREGWQRLGRLADDRVVRRGQSRRLVVSTFGFERRDRHSELPKKLRTQSSEVAFAWWVPLSRLDPAHLEWKRLPLIGSGFTFPRAIESALRGLGATHIDFAKLQLPQPPGASDAVDTPLWGLTLSLLSEVLRRADAEPLVGPGAPLAFSHAYGVAGRTMVERVLRVLLALRGREGQVRLLLLGTMSLTAAITARWLLRVRLGR